MAATKNNKAFYNAEIPSDWELLDMWAICSKITDGTHDTPTPIESGIPFLTALHVKEERIDFENCYFLPEEIHKEIFRRCNPERDDVLMVNIGAGVATTALVNVDFEFSLKNVALLKPNRKKVIGSYLNYYQTFIKPKLTQTLLNGGAQPFLSLKQIHKLKVNVPPLPEQKAIAQVLSTADAAIHTTEKLIAQKELRKKWLMQQLLSEKRIVKNEKWCKSGVKEVFLKDVAKVIMGQSPSSEDYNTVGLGLPLIQGNADLTDRKQVFRYWTSQSNKECDIGDIIMTVRAPVGAIGLATQKSSIGRGVCSIKPQNIDYWYLYHLLVYKEEQWIKLEQGSTFNAVGSKDIFHFPLFVVHSTEEQTAIAQVLQAADKEISLLKAKAEKLREQKKGLMQVLLTGKKRLNYDSSDFYDYNENK